MSWRNLIPKSGGGYLLYFMAAAGLLSAMLYFYCVPPALDGAPEEGLTFLDLTAPGSLFRWFVSIIWLLIAGMSFILTFFSCSIRGGGLKSIFWCSVGTVAFAMSVDTVCSFLPFFKSLLDQKVMEYSGDEASSSVTFWILGIIAFLFVLSEVCFLWRYIRSMFGHRLVLKFFFLSSAVLLIAAVVFHCVIPSPESPTASLSGTSQRAERLAPAKKSETAALRPTDIKRPDAPPSRPEEEKEEEDASDDYRYVAFEKPVLPETDSAVEKPSGAADAENGLVTRWEDIFGWEKTAEEYLGMKVNLEEVVGLDVNIEQLVFGDGAKLDLVRTREALRQGAYGFFLLFFSTGLALLARAERIGFDRQIKLGRYSFINHPERVLTEDI